MNSDPTILRLNTVCYLAVYQKKNHQYEQKVLCVYIFQLVSVMAIFGYSLRNIGVTNAVISPLMTYHHVCNKRNTTGATRETGTIYPSRAPGFTRMNSDLIHVPEKTQ